MTVGRPSGTFADIGRLLRGEFETNQPLAFEEPAFRRLAEAYEMGLASSVDLAVLIRQVLRYTAIRSPGEGSELHLSASESARLPSIKDWPRFGINAQQLGLYQVVSAQVWAPAWLDCSSTDSPDSACAEAQRRIAVPVSGDPFLELFGRTTYRSPGQRAAIRATLSTPPGGVLVICLPTGDGKSFVFQCIARVGFGEPDERTAAATVVVTPTVALAQDHELAARELGFADIPRAYVGGDSRTNLAIRQRIADGTQGLVFASPEAVCGPLRKALMTAAELHQVRALVVDEAHLIDAWGAEFRPDFQLLSGMRSELLNASGGSLRTILLSATYTEGAMRTLRAFFSERSKSGPSSFRVVSAAQLRPEPAYWVAPVSNETERDRRVMEAIHHLPRPLVLYTTRIEDANRWYGILWQLGFRRLACVTGDTRADDRNRAVQGWHLGRLDLVVATSAFGLGIDNPNVRSVVHACIPETLDRFYQEVGRAGRDGASSVSLLLPTQRDFELATGLNQTKVISIDLGLPRWRSMFHHPDRLIHDHDEYTVRLDVPPGSDARQIDMTSRENTDWNQRTLTLMAGAGLIELVGPVTRTPRYGPDADSVVDGVSQERAYQTVRIVHPGHSDEETWRDLVEPRRQAISGANRLSLRAIERYVRRPDQMCIEGILRPLYELPGGDDMPPIAVAKACGGCPTCRASGHAPYAQRLPEPPQPWANWGGVRPPADRELDSRGRLLVFYDEADLRNRRTSRRFTNVLGTLILSGFRNLVVLDDFELDRSELLERVGDAPWFVAERWIHTRLPDGPTLVFASAKTPLRASMWTPRGRGDARIVFVPDQARDPELSDATLRNRHSGRTVGLLEFIGRLTA